MPWYSPWSDHITKRVCKYLLQRYLGQFLEEKLTLDQLNVDLYKGIGIISDVSLDVQALNEVAEQQNIPFEFIDGFVGKVSVSVPWSSILKDATYIEVEGLSLTIKQKERYKTRASMIESMWSSMSSSMQLAEECLKNEKKESEGKEDETSNFEGIEHFAQTIDSILNMIKVKFLDTRIRLEEVTLNGNFGVAFELDIKLMDYVDESGLEPDDRDRTQEFEQTVFSTKKIFLEGVTVHSSEFSVSGLRNSCGENENLQENNTDEDYSDSIILGRLAGRQEVTIKFKQEGISGPKIELEISLGAFTVYTTPHQAHNLLDLINGVTIASQKDVRNEAKSHCPERRMDDSDYRQIEQELQMNMTPGSFLQTKGLTDQGWANMSLDMSDDEFSPLNNSKFNSSIISSATSLTCSTSSISSSKSSFIQSKPSTFRSKKTVHSGNGDLDSSSVVFHFHVLLSSLAIILLHDDILTASSDGNADDHISASSIEAMRRSAKDFFERLGHFAVVGYGHKDFAEAQDLFSKACDKNHLRFLAAPVIIEGNETCTVNVSVIKGTCTAASLDIRECLFEKDPASQKQSVEYVELLKFTKHHDSTESRHAFDSQLNMKMNFKLSNSTSQLERSRKYSHPKSEFSLSLQPCESEIDVTIIDRISALLNKEAFFGSRNCTTSDSCDPSQRKLSQSHFQRAVETAFSANSKLDLKIFSPFITFKLRFPIPDFRPIHDMDKLPWWKRSVRSDVLFLDVTDFAFHTTVRSQETVFKFEMQFRDAVAKFREGDCEKAVPFLRASVDPNNETLTEYDQGLGYPRLVLHVFPSNQTCLEENDTYLGYYKSSHNSMGQQSLITTLENTTKKEHSPFSCKKVVYESDTPHSSSASEQQEGGEELVIPGDKAEIADFIDVASTNTRIKLDLSLPSASLVFPSKHMYEVLYNRISSDLLLWEPSAPVLVSSPNYPDLNSWPVNDVINNFHLCKSGIQSDSDSDLESPEESFYSAYEQKLRYKKKQLMEKHSLVGQSKVVLNLNIAQGLFDLYTPARDSQGNVIPGQHGQLHVSFGEGRLFLVSGFKGKPDLDYLCVQVSTFSVFHNGLISDTLQKYTYVGSKVPSYLQQLVHNTDTCASVDGRITPNRTLGNSDMLTVSVRVERNGTSHDLKMFRVAAGIRNATLRHIVCKGQTSWITQLIDFFDVDDYPIAGHEPCSILTEINVHLWNCCVDYRPLYLPIRSLLTVGNFNISSNMAAQTNSSTLRFIAEEAAFFISDKNGTKMKYAPADVRRDYVCVGEIGLFELSLRLSEKNQPHPKVDLRASGNVAHVWTCADSAKALAELLVYFASDGDFAGTDMEDVRKGTNQPTSCDDEENVLVRTDESSEVLSKSQVSLVIDLMDEAMKESRVLESEEKKIGDGMPKVIYYERDEDEDEDDPPLQDSVQESLSLGSELERDATEHVTDLGDKEDNWESEFCILEHEAGLGLLPKKGLPEVRNLTGTPVRLVDNHFSVPLGKADLLRSPKHYPKPVLRYLLREMSVVWHMYGGSDFGCGPNNKQVKIGHGVGSEGAVSYSKNTVRFECQNAQPNLNWKERGGPKRRHDILMELQLNKIRFQHEVYPNNTNEASRQVLLIQDMEMRDRLAKSPINKFLYQYTSEAKPKQSQAPMVLLAFDVLRKRHPKFSRPSQVIVKSVLMRSDPKLNAQECCLKVSLLPLRLNIDQDAVLFLYSFFNEVTGDMREEVDEDPSPRAQPSTPKQNPIMSVNVHGKKPEEEPEPNNLLIELDEDSDGKKLKTKTKKKGFSISNKHPSPPLFFRCFIFGPDVPVKLDYQGKRVDMTHGPLAGILMGLGQLNNSELKLRKISHKHGLLGFDKLVNFVLTEWTNDIKKNQLPGLLGGVGPMHSLVQLIQGIRDLFWLPIEQYQRDGRLVRGFQRGANSFTTSTAMACLELTSRVIQLIQSTAETAYDMVSPGPSVRSRRQGNGKRRRHPQPADIREGVANAYLVVKEGIGETAETIVRVASEEHEQKGVTGAVGGVLRQIPPTVVKPIILATEATNNVIGGMRSQLVPDARKEAVEKWRKHDL